MTESEILIQLQKEVEALRVLLLAIGEAICASIQRLPEPAEDMLKLNLDGLLNVTAEAEVTHADGTKG